MTKTRFERYADAESANGLTARFELKQLSDEGEFEGYASVFDVMDDMRDIIAPGAFAATLREKGTSGIKMLWQHNRSQPIGTWTEMHEDKRGLFVKGNLVMGVQQASEAHALMKAGALDGLSIGFSTVTATWDDDELTRTLTEIDLWEVSPVTFPANDAARIEAVKAIDRIETSRDFERFLRDAGFSRTFATALTNHGFVEAKRLSGQGDPDGGLEELVGSIRGITGTLQAN